MAQRVLVTAGAAGIGKEIARAFVASGAKVPVCDIDTKALADAASELPGLHTVVCDVSKRADIGLPTGRDRPFPRERWGRRYRWRFPISPSSPPATTATCAG